MFDEKDLMKNPFQTNKKFQENIMDLMKEESEFERIVKLLTIPAKSGIYLSKIDIKRIGYTIGVDVPVRERREMLKDIFYYSKQMNAMETFLDNLKKFVEDKIYQYRELSESFPKTANIIQEWINKAENLIRLIERMKNELKTLGNIY